MMASTAQRPQAPNGAGSCFPRPEPLMAALRNRLSVPIAPKLKGILAMPIHVAITRLPGNDDIPLPTYQSPASAGVDLHAAICLDLTLSPNETGLIPCGVAIALPLGFEAQIRPRSGIATMYSVIIPNSPGTIDSDYRGELKVALLNLGRNPFVVRRGMRVAQMVFAPVAQIQWDLMADLPPTVRGGGGFGHTGD
jgi:dUTP pyrophosphatase